MATHLSMLMHDVSIAKFSTIRLISGNVFMKCFYDWFLEKKLIDFWKCFLNEIRYSVANSTFSNDDSITFVMSNARSSLWVPLSLVFIPISKAFSKLRCLFNRCLRVSVVWCSIVLIIIVLAWRKVVIDIWIIWLPQYFSNLFPFSLSHFILSFFVSFDTNQHEKRNEKRSKHREIVVGVKNNKV